MNGFFRKGVFLQSVEMAREPSLLAVYLLFVKKYSGAVYAEPFHRAASTFPSFILQKADFSFYRFLLQNCYYTDTIKHHC